MNLNEYYLATGWPTTNSPGASSPARSELSLINTAFNKLPALAGNGLLMVRVNAAGTGLEAVSYATATVETYADVQAGGQILVAAAKTAPVAGDIWGMLDSAAGNILKQVTFQNLFNVIGVLINGATSKATPVDADSILIQDSAASNASKQLTWANLKTTLAALTTTWGISTTGNAATATSVTGIGNAAAFDARFGSSMFPFTCTQASNLLTGTLTSPFKMDFRNVTLTTGTPVLLEQAINLSLAMTSTLGSLGAPTAILVRLAWALVYAAGTPQIAVANITGGLQTDETNLITTSAIGAGSTSSATWYSTSAIGTPSQYRIIGFTDATWTSGTGWGSPSVVQPIGTGQVSIASVIDNTGAASDIVLGVGQTAIERFTATTSIPLHIATGDNQLYELVIAGTGVSSAGVSTLSPNNTTYGTALTSIYILGLAGAVTSGGSVGRPSFDLCFGNGGLNLLRSLISTKTTSKNVNSDSMNNISGTSGSQVQKSLWRDTTTAWTSLGTVTLAVADTGIVYIRRLA